MTKNKPNEIEKRFPSKLEKPKAGERQPVADIDEMRKMAKVTSAILKALARSIQPGISLFEVNEIGERLMASAGVESYNKGYKPSWSKTPFPASVCTSVNNCIAHGIPTAYKLKEGDIICMDIGITRNGFCGDSAITVPVGKISQKHQDLLKFARYITYHAIGLIKDGVEVSEIGSKTMNLANRLGYKTNWMLSGHGIGHEMHEAPTIPFHRARGKEVSNHQVYDVGKMYDKRFGGVKLETGRVVCIEPMVTHGVDAFGEKHSDGWSYLTRDGAYSAMYEAMVLVKDDGYEILTDHFDKNGICL